MNLTARILTLLFSVALLLILGCGLDAPTSGAPEITAEPPDHSALAMFPLTTGNRWEWQVNVYGNLNTEYDIVETIGEPDSLYGRYGYQVERLTIFGDDTTRIDTLYYTFNGDTLLESPPQTVGWYRAMIGTEDVALGDTLVLNGFRGAYAQYLGDHHAISAAQETFTNCILLRYNNFLHTEELDYFYKSGVGVVRIDMRYYTETYGPREPYQTRVFNLTSYSVE